MRFRRIKELLYVQTHPALILKHLNGCMDRVKTLERLAKNLEASLDLAEEEISQYKEITATFTDKVIRNLQRLATAAEIIKETGTSRVATAPEAEDIMSILDVSPVASRPGRVVQAVDYMIRIRMPIETVMDFPPGELADEVRRRMAKAIGEAMFKEFLGGE